MSRSAPALAVSTTFLLLGACAVTQVDSVMRPSISGSLDIRAADGSQTTRWTPDRCVSGDLAYFAGFDFLSSQDPGHLRAALDPIDGPAARWTQGGAGPERAVLILRRADCATLDLDVQPTAWRINDVREFAGHVRLSCTAPDGTRVEGRIDVDHCH
jgi:hypothetical protein